MPSLFVVFKGLGVAERRHLRLYTEELFPSVFDAQLQEHTELSRRYLGTITLTNHLVRESHATLLATTLSARKVNGRLN